MPDPGSPAALLSPSLLADIGAGSSTQPNTPRSSHDPRESPDNVLEMLRPISRDSLLRQDQCLPQLPPLQDIVDNCSSASSGASSSTESSCLPHADIEPTWPRPMDLDIKKVSAKATWEGHSLTGLELDASVAVLRDDLTGQIKQSLAELREEVISQLDELRGELTSGLDAEQEARDLDMAQMEDGIMRQISEASIAITFDDAPLRASLSFPDHPFW